MLEERRVLRSCSSPNTSASPHLCATGCRALGECALPMSGSKKRERSGRAEWRCIAR